MKSKILITVLLSTWSLLMKAQMNYEPFIQDSAVWIVRNADLQAPFSWEDNYFGIKCREILH